jgi:cytochrome oxidase Cu insertion factor (SCO1/SenC/PrrC family)
MRLTGIFAALLAALLWSAPLSAHEGEVHEDSAQPGKRLTMPAPEKITPRPGEEERARQYFTDLPVFDQLGQEHRFFTDLLKDRTVLVNLFYTECTGSCPINTEQLARVQDLLGEQFGRDIFFVSVSIDPETDSVEKIKEYVDKFDIADGWYFVTGAPGNLKAIASRFGQTSREIAAHSPLFMIGNVKIARWAKLRPNMPAEAIAARLQLMSSYTAAAK